MRPPFAMSQSSLKVLLACPHSFRATYLTPGDKPAGERAGMGKACHEVIAEYIAHCWRTRKAWDRDWLYEHSGPLLDSAVHTGRLAPHLRAEVENVLGIFASSFRLQRKHTLNYYPELLLAVDRDWQPLELGRDYSFDHAAHRATGYERDIITGQLDVLRLYRHRGKLKAELFDWKAGLTFVRLSDAQGNLQLQTYAALAFAHYPELTEVTAVIHGIQYGAGNKDHVTFNRSIVDDVRAKYEQGFDLLDALYAADWWQAVGLTASVCQWCTAQCPIADAADIAQAGMEPLKPMRTKFTKKRAA